MMWSRSPALEVVARREAIEAAGPCPACGADPDVDLFIIDDGDHWFPGEVRCSARCYDRDPEAYLAALAARGFM